MSHAILSPWAHIPSLHSRFLSASAAPEFRPYPNTLNLHTLIATLLFLSTSVSIPIPLSLSKEPAATVPLPLTDSTPSAPDITITDRVFLDFSICPNYFRSDLTLADDPTTCLESQPLGRLVLGLYGILACLDGYMNIAMEQTEEYVNGQLKNKYGDAFIRGNNVLYISTSKRTLAEGA